MQLRCQGISFEQAAQQLSQKISSVRSAYQRGLAILRSRLSVSKTSESPTGAQNRKLSSPQTHPRKIEFELRFCVTPDRQSSRYCGKANQVEG
jgi:hypothetical protein